MYTLGAGVSELSRAAANSKRRDHGLPNANVGGSQMPTRGLLQILQLLHNLADGQKYSPEY